MKTLLALLLVASAAPAFAGKVRAITPENMGDVQDLEEVVIQGDHTLVAARIAIDDAENRFFKRWNELNPDRQYDVFCDRPYTRTGTLLRLRRCKAQFELDAEEEIATQLLRDFGIGGVGALGLLPLAPDAYLLSQQAELKRRALEMAKTDDQMKRALFERARLARHYQVLHEEKFRNHWIAR